MKQTKTNRWNSAWIINIKRLQPNQSVQPKCFGDYKSLQSQIFQSITTHSALELTSLQTEQQINNIVCDSLMRQVILIITRAFRECKPLPTPNFQPKVIQDSNPDFQINPDPDVCRICHKMLWMHYLVGISHFAKYGTNRPLMIWEMLSNIKKSPIPQRWRNEKLIWNPHTDPNHHQKLITSTGSPLAQAYQVWSTSVSALVSYPVYRMTDRMTKRMST